jgi:hypothetical protein
MLIADFFKTSRPALVPTDHAKSGILVERSGSVVVATLAARATLSLSLSVVLQTSFGFPGL